MKQYAVVPIHLYYEKAAMSDHFSLVVALLMTLLYGWCKIRSQHEPDWCGLVLFPRVLLQLCPALLAVFAVYVEIVHVLHFPRLSQYFVLISLTAATIADYFSSRFLREVLGITTAVSSTIAQYKIETTDHLESSPECSATILKNAITTSRLPSRRRNALCRGLGNPPTREQIFKIIDAVGLAHIRAISRQSRK
jgi:hypothetical protein